MDISALTHWGPEGFEQNDDIYSQEPDKSKRIDD